jgi:serine protease Do
VIRKTLGATKNATFAVLLPNIRNRGLPTPNGTGFFVSPDGWFITAAHVVTENGSSNGPVRKDIGQGWLQQELGGQNGFCQNVALELVDPETDFALLKCDFSARSNKAWLVGKSNFPYIEVSSRPLEEAEPVYAFGYPLSEGTLVVSGGPVTIGHIALCPRVTSAIVASTVEATKMLTTSGDSQSYCSTRA